MECHHIQPNIDHSQRETEPSLGLALSNAFDELLTALLSNENTLCRGDTPTAKENPDHLRLQHTGKTRYTPHTCMRGSR